MTHRWYLFLDEGGDLNFKGNGSRFFTVSSLATRRPFELAAVLADQRLDVIEEGLDIEYFRVLPPGTSYRVLHHASMSAPLLQAADYCNWAVFRKAERADERSYGLIAGASSLGRLGARGHRRGVRVEPGSASTFATGPGGLMELERELAYRTKLAVGYGLRPSRRAR